MLLTDGQVSNEPALIEMARKHRGHARLFTFGIGAACSAYLVNGLARATGGAAEFVGRDERIDDKVLRTFSRIASPAVTDVEIDWGNADVQTLAEIPPVFDGDPMVVFARVAGRMPESIGLKCTTANGPRQWTMAAPSAMTDDDGAIATMWARRAIQSCEEVTPLRRGGLSQRDRLISLSREFNLLCSLTTYIAIEHRSESDRNEGRPALRRVPVMYPRGVDELLDEIAAPTRMMRFSLERTCDRTIELPMMRRRGLGETLAGLLGAQSFLEPEISRSLRDSEDTAKTPPRQKSDPALDVRELLKLQQADGAFDVGPAFDRVQSQAASKITQWKRAMKQHWPATAPKSGDQRDRIVQTTLVLLLLHHLYSQHQPLWRASEQKAMTWLVKATGIRISLLEEWLKRVA